MHLYFLILSIFPLFYAQFKQWTFKMSLDSYLPYITLNLGSKTQSLRTFIDISNRFSFVSSNVYQYKDSFTFSKKNNITVFKYNNKDMMGYLSNDSMIYYGDRYEFKNFYLVYSDTNYDKYSMNSKSVLCQSRNVSNTEDNFSISITRKNLFDEKGNFIFAAKEFPDFDEYEFDMGRYPFSETDWREEVIFGYTIMRLFSLSFDADMNQIRFYNDIIIHSILPPSNFLLIKNLLLIVSLILLLSIFALKIKSITINSVIYKY